MQAYSVYITLCIPYHFVQYLKQNENVSKFRKRTLHFGINMTS